MTDQRSFPDPVLATRSDPMQITAPVVDLCRSPAGPRDRQLIYGEDVTVLHEAEGWSLVRAKKDGYCGCVPVDTLGQCCSATHQVTARTTHCYDAADLKSVDQMCLTFGSQLVAVSETATFIETADGYVPRQHVHRISDRAEDPIEIAKLFLGTPYLWGGNSGWGIDCSGLVQAALLACHIPCPGDSDQQEQALGTALPVDSGYEPGDLLFWKGHVALVCDTTHIIHANAGHMAVAREGIDDAIARIRAQGDGPVTAHKRLQA
ncbi:C40 family peptidase [Roseobacter sp. YSTF-M11]|uniref:C40 family peptidase n=1 Tax=Roseobacter insulae TaxID=2859783 RepID=A0A9X1JX43_9RHOB|nr:NlpC/P60 family protein [Roseobacter insulae]MBW4706606.1 C40 family peptidase [Roseobacter insulae]